MDQPYQNNNNEYNNGYNNGGYNNNGYNNGNNGNHDPGAPGPGKGNDPKRQNILLLILAAIITMVFLSMLMKGIRGGTVEVSYSEFVKMVEADKVESVNFISDRLEFSLKTEGNSGKTEDAKENAAENSVIKRQEGLYSIWGVPTQNYYTIRVPDEELTKRLLDHGVTIKGQTTTLMDSIVSFIVGVVLPVGLMWLLLSFLFRKMSKSGGFMGMGMGKNTAKVYVQKETGVTFKDVAGEDEAKESLVEVVDFLHNPGKYSQVGAKLPKGALLVGPPGTGKTLLAKAVAGEAGVPFFSISGSDFLELYVGVGAARVRDLFDQATKAAPSIIFIDEIDAVGRRRGAGLGGGHDEREQTLNQLLVEMDGFEANNSVIVMAATNRRDVLDPALLRPGRFDRQVYVNYPDIKGREAILRVHSKNKPLAPDVDLKQTAAATVGFTGADLANLVNEAALMAVKADRKAITAKDLSEAAIKVIAGPEKKSRVVLEKEKKLTAYHEAGHAICHYYCPTQDKVSEVSIIPRGQAGGYTMSLPEHDKSYSSKNEMSEEIVTLLGGRAAEKVVLDDISTGASNDLERATNIARSMVTKYGFSDKLGPIVYGRDDDEVFLGRDYNSNKSYSEVIAGEIDAELRSIIHGAYDKAIALLTEHVDQLHVVAKYLITHEKINGDEFIKLMNGEILCVDFDDAVKYDDVPPASTETL